MVFEGGGKGKKGLLPLVLICDLKRKKEINGKRMRLRERERERGENLREDPVERERERTRSRES